MSREPSLNTEQKQRRWTEDEVLVLLCSLNSEIVQIRKEFYEDRNEGVRLASIILSKTLGKDCSPSRAVGKIEHLWKECGPSGPYRSSLTNSMYCFGAWTRTLPYLDALYPGMLEKIALASRKEQSANIEPDNRPLRVKTLRRREKDELADPIECICGFAHFASSCVHCAICPTWQHIWCYYGKDDNDAPPSDHTCRKCSVNSDDNNLVEELERLNLECRQAAVNVTREHAVRSADAVNSARHMRNDDSLLFGLSDGEVQSTVLNVTSMVRSIAHSVDTDDFEFHIQSEAGDHSDLDEVLRQVGHKPLSPGLELSSLDHFLLLRVAISSAIWTWTFDKSSITKLERKAEGSSEALFEAYQNILLSHDRELLLYIHRKAWTTLLSDQPEILELSIRKKAEELARRLLCMLSSLVKRSPNSGDSRSLRTADDWIKHTNNGLSRFNALSGLFLRSIKLKYMLPLSEQYYELYFPASSESYFVSNDPEDRDRKIKFCFAPAILEYDPEIFEMAGPGGCGLFGEKNFIHATNEQRRSSRIVCRADAVFH